MPETIAPISRPAPLPPERERTPRNAVLVVNTKARRGQEWFGQAQDCLRSKGITIDAARALEDPSRLPDVLRQSLSEGAKLIIVGGGDGSLRCAAGILAEQEAALGVLPLGTVNDFARNLGIEPNVESACEVIAEGQVARVDVCRANEEPFLITASLGFSAQMQQQLTPELKKRFGPFGYLIASIRALRSLRQLTIRISCAEANESRKVIQAGLVHGHSWMGGAFEIPGLDLESGRLAFYAVPPRGGLDYLRMARSLMRQRFFHTPGLRSFLMQEITIEADPPQPLVLDGDFCGQTPVRICIHHDALKVCVPPSFERI